MVLTCLVWVGHIPDGSPDMHITAREQLLHDVAAQKAPRPRNYAYWKRHRVKLVQVT